MTRLNRFFFTLVAVTLIGGANVVLGQFGVTLITLMDPSGEFMSIGYPNSVPAHTAWRITVEEGYRIQLQFLDFQLNETDICYLDNIRLYDAAMQDDVNSLIGVWCWNNFTKLMPNTFTSTNNSFYLFFRGHGGSTRKGFKVMYFSFNSSLTTTKSTSHVPSTTVGAINPGTHPDSSLLTNTENTTHVPGTTVGTINPGPHTATIIAGGVAVIISLCIVVVCIICVFYNRRIKRKNEKPVDITPYYTNYQVTSGTGNTMNQSQDSNTIQLRDESGGTVYEVPSNEGRSDIASDNYDKNIYSRKIHV